MDKKEQASYAKTRSNKLQTQRKMVYKTGSRNNIPIYRSAIIFFDNRRATRCYADNRQQTTDYGQQTTDNRLRSGYRSAQSSWLTANPSAKRKRSLSKLLVYEAELAILENL